MLEAESTPGPWCGRKDYVNEKSRRHHRESNPQTLYYQGDQFKDAEIEGKRSMKGRDKCVQKCRSEDVKVTGLEADMTIILVWILHE